MSSVLKLSLTWGPITRNGIGGAPYIISAITTKMRKKNIVKIKKSTILKNGKMVWRYVWIATFHENLALIRLVVFWENPFSDGQTVDGRTRHPGTPRH